MVPYLKSTPRNWFLPLIGPASAAEELPDIRTLPDLSERPRTMPENQELGAEAEEETDGAVPDEVDREDVEESAGFMSRPRVPRHAGRSSKR